MEERKEVKYPIKYAIMPIEEQVGWYTGLNQLEREYGVVVNIVSKCYVISEKKTYLSNGTYEILYEVVFPYVQEGYTGHKIRSGRSIPEFNIYSQCTNSISVAQLFDSFEDASVVANQLNQDILHHEIGCLSFDKEFKTNVEKLRIKHQETLNRYKNFENYVKKETINMEVTKAYSSTLEDVIEKIVESPSEFYMKVAYALSVEEREHLKELIETRSCNSCTNGSCRVENSEKVGLDESGKPQGSNCLSWNNPELVGRQRVLTKQII